MITSDYVFSPSRAAFYPVALREVYEAGEGWPEDGVSVRTELYEQMLAGQEAGMRIAADASGQPVLVDPPPLTEAERMTKARPGVTLSLHRPMAWWLGTVTSATWVMTPLSNLSSS